MANELYKKLFSMFYKDLVVLFTFSFVYMFFEEKYNIKTNFRENGYEYDILYDHSSIEISFRRSKETIENLSEYIKKKRKRLNKCSFIFIVDDDQCFNECLKIIEKYKDIDFIVMEIEKESNVIKNIKINNPNLTRLYKYIKERFSKIRIDKFVEDEGFLISPLTCEEITRQYKIIFMFMYFILERFRMFIKNENSFNLVEFINKEIIGYTNIKNKELLLEKWLNLISNKIIKIFKVSLDDYDKIKNKITQLEKIINELYELSRDKEVQNENIKSLLDKYSKEIKQK